MFKKESNRMNIFTYDIHAFKHREKINLLHQFIF